jgi:hypothetical protein
MDFKVEAKLDNTKRLQTNMKAKSGKAISEVSGMKRVSYSPFRIGYRCGKKSKDRPDKI